MEAGRELDALVAEKVMGWVLNRHEFGSELPGGPLKSLGIAPDGSHIMGLPHFSTNISAAWEVVQSMIERGYAFRIDSYWCRPLEIRFWSPKKGMHHKPFMAEAENLYRLPHAICLAALKAMGVEED